MPDASLTFTWDGEEIPARPGEPIAAALWRAGHVVQTRSLKYHRPRGPMCMTGDCPGCMVRVDGVPNVRGCRTPAREGLEVESQTGWPSAQRDVLEVVDHVFERFDHERSFVRPRPVNKMYETVARHLAGFGTQPTGTLTTREGRHLEPDVLVAGAGPAGLAAARELVDAGEDVLLVDDPIEGASLAYHETPIETPEHAADGGFELADALLDEIPEQARQPGTVFGLYEDGPAAVLGRDDEALAVHTVDAETTVLAVGAYEGPALLPGNDTPGALAARAARILLARWDTRPGDPVAVLDPGRQARAFACQARESGIEVHEVPDPERIEGDDRVEAVHGASGRVEAEAAVFDPGLTPNPELVQQAGLPTTWEQALGGRVPLHRPDGTTPVPDVYVAGSCAGLHTVEAGLVQGRAAGRAAAGLETPDVAKPLASTGLTDEETTAIRRVWNA